VCDFNCRNQFPECHETQNEDYATGGNANTKSAQFSTISNNTDLYTQTCEVGTAPPSLPFHREIKYDNRPSKHVTFFLVLFLQNVKYHVVPMSELSAAVGN